MEDVELDPEREQQMLERVKAEFLQQDTENDAKKVPGGHQIGRRVIFVSAAAVLIMVVSFAFSVFMPESVSHARGFVRSAAIWVNNTLHLGYEFEEPVANPMQWNEQEVIYSTLEEAAANVPYPLLYLDDSTLQLHSVSLLNVSSLSSITIAYQNGSAIFNISIHPTAESVLTGLDRSTRIPWQHGEFVCWESDSLNYALSYYSGMEISIYCSGISHDTFLALCQALKLFN